MADHDRDDREPMLSGMATIPDRVGPRAKRYRTTFHQTTFHQTTCHQTTCHRTTCHWIICH